MWNGKQKLVYTKINQFSMNRSFPVNTCTKN